MALGSECAVLAAALSVLTPRALDHQPAGALLIHEDVKAIDRIDPDWARHFAKEDLVPPRGMETASLRGCLGRIRNYRLVSAPSSPHGACHVGDGIWIARPAVEGHRAVVLIVENECATDGWLVALTRADGGRWRAGKPKPMWFSLFEPARR